MPEKIYEKEVVIVDVDIEDLIPSFLENRADEVGAIRKCLSESNFKEAMRLGHGMKGAGAGYGFDEISVIGKIIEDASKQEDAPAVEAAVSRLARYLSVVEVVYEEDE